MASTGKGKAPAAPEEKPPVDGDSLEDIFIRLDAADLARASIACTSFRGAIADPAFRRRFGRLLHPPPLVGFVDYEAPTAPYHRTPPRTLHPVSTPAARAVAGAADFTCSFLPDPGSWRIRDASDGRLLLSSRPVNGFRDLMVCDPLHRTFVRVPPVPDHLILADAGKYTPGPGMGWFPFLVPLQAPLPASEKGKAEKEPPLQVVSMLHRRDKTMMAFVFSSSTQEWRRIPTFGGWKSQSRFLMCHRHYARGCFFWTAPLYQRHTAIKLDIREMRFSSMELPSVTQPLLRTNFIVEAGEEGDLGMLVIGDHSLDLYCRSRQGNGGGAGADWAHSRTIPLPDDSLDYNIVGAGDGYLLLQAYPLFYFVWEPREPRYFSLKLKTLVLEELRLPFSEQLICVHLYTSFPPLLSLPRVGKEENAGQDQGQTGETSAIPDGSRTISSSAP